MHLRVVNLYPRQHDAGGLIQIFVEGYDVGYRFPDRIQGYYARDGDRLAVIVLFDARLFRCPALERVTMSGIEVVFQCMLHARFEHLRKHDTAVIVAVLEEHHQLAVLFPLGVEYNITARRQLTDHLFIEERLPGPILFRIPTDEMVVFFLERVLRESD